VARGFAGGVLTILRERKEILVERSSVAAVGVAGDRERAGRPIKVSTGKRASATYGAAGVERSKEPRRSRLFFFFDTQEDMDPLEFFYIYFVMIFEK
jgi:hypothetical protein